MLDLLVPVGTGPVLLGGVLALLVVVALAVALLRARAAAERARVQARAAADTVAELRAEVAEVQRRLAAGTPQRRTREDGSEYVITHLGDEEAAPRHAAGVGPEQQPRVETRVETGVETRIEAGLFADLVLRESVVRAASLVHGVRAALAPETRNRIRFEVRREVRRARKQRRADTRLARREHASRQRAVLTDDEDAA